MAAEIIKQNFLQELRDASEGKSTSLAFIKHQLPSEKLVKNDEIFQVMVVGGTVLKKALVKKAKDQIATLKISSENHSAFSSEKTFIDLISNNIYPSLGNITINLAFPLAPLIRDGRLDGKLLGETKENVFKNLLGRIIGQTLEENILITQNRTTKISIASDAICLLASANDKSSNENLAGAIVGTGANISFFYGTLAVNLESGSFNKFAPSTECLEIDKTSDHQSKGLFEKEIAGAYLYKQFNYYLEKNKINHPLINSTKELYDVAINNHDIEIKAIAESFFEKSAAYFAGQIAGLAVFKNKPLTIVMEGSMYWKNPQYQKYFDDYIKELSPGLEIKIVKVENSSIIGAAKLIA